MPTQNDKDQKNSVSDPLDAETKEGEESFANLLDSYSDGMNDDIQVGDKISGKIISIEHDTIFIDTGTKNDGAVEKSELLDENGEFPYQKGDILELYVIKRTENELRLSKMLSGIGGLKLLEDAFQNKIPVEGKVVAKCKGGFNIEIMKKRTFCPISQIDIKYVNYPDDYVGQTFSFLISQFEESGRNVVVSRRAILQEEQDKAIQSFLQTLSVGQTLEGKVSKLMPFGAFIELLPGVEGMVHVSEISWGRIEKPEDELSVGKNVTIKVLDIKQQNNNKPPKIGLSIKQAQENPWQRASELLKVGEIIQGRITQITNFGAFVELVPGIEGLVHISEMSYLKRITRVEDVASIGETVSVMVKDVNYQNKRISLSMRDAEGDPWANVKNNYKVGQTLKGTIEKKEKFGYFINLAPGITGLLPKSKLTDNPDAKELDKLKSGDQVTITILEINLKDRKITLDYGTPKDEDEWKNFVDEPASAMGSLGEKLQAAMNSNAQKPTKK